MTRNEYRRALIMLRALQKGYSGHVRLERRTTLGNMCFSVNAEQCGGKLYGVLVGRRRDDYYAYALGELMRDRRGQATLNVGFDPRNIDGRPLDAYQLVTVVNVEGDTCRLVLAGNVNGSFEMNWTAVQNVACSLFVRTVEPRGSIGMSENIPDETEKATEVVSDTGEELIMTPVSAPETEYMLQAFDEPGEENEENAEGIVAAPAKQTEVSYDYLMTERQDNSAEDANNQQTMVCNASELLGISPESDWPEALSAVRMLFDMSSPFEGIAVPGYIFVQAPLPENTGYPFCVIGICAGNGKPKSVCYALPAAFSPEPPPGLEGYVWRGDGNNGWWTIFLDAETGEELEIVP